MVHPGYAISTLSAFDMKRRWPARLGQSRGAAETSPLAVCKRRSKIDWRDGAETVRRGSAIQNAVE